MNLEAMLAQAIEARAKLVTDVEALEEARDAIMSGATAEKRSALNEDEAKALRAKIAEIDAVDAKIDELDADIRSYEAQIERAGRRDAETKRHAKATATVTVTSEARTYEKGNGASYVQDLMRRQFSMADDDTLDRLRRHGVEAATDKEYRNLNRTDGSGGYFVPPLWAMQRFMELARSSRPYANLVPSEGMPAGTDSLSIPKIATGTSTAIQNGDNTAISETDLTDTSVTIPVRTIAGAQGLSIQLLDQSPLNFDEIVFRDLAADYATKVDLQVISGSGANGQVKGVRNSTGITTIAATSAGAQLAKLKLVYAKIGDAIQRVHTSRFLPPEVIVMHPRRWAAFNTQTAGDDRPWIVANGPAVNQLAQFGGVVSQQVVGQMHGLPVLTDPNLPVNLGAGTNEDVVHVLRASDLLLFESGIRARTLEQTRAETLTVLLQIYGYIAFTAERYPASVVEIGGTALTAPTFE